MLRPKRGRNSPGFDHLSLPVPPFHWPATAPQLFSCIPDYFTPSFLYASKHSNPSIHSPITIFSSTQKHDEGKANKSREGRKRRWRKKKRWVECHPDSIVFRCFNLDDKNKRYPVPHTLQAVKQGDGRQYTMIKTGIRLLIGALIGSAILILSASCCLFKRRPKSNPSQPKSTQSEPKAIPSKPKSTPSRGDYVSEVLISEELGCKEIPIREIYAATNNLSALNFIGQGVAGKVYKGTLSNGYYVAIKHIIKDGYVDTFVREVTSLSHVRHPNLVTLRGYSEEQEECFLVYELCANGNLSEWLFGKNKTLSWVQRLEIAIGSARGLWFLHTYPGGCIVHRDVKPTNILLGDDFEAKLSDFGLSKVMAVGVSHVSSEVRGTFGYVDPEYRQNHHVNAAGDLYSFGMVLLQILSGQRVIDLKLTKPMPLDKMAKLVAKGGNISEFADPKLNGEYSTEAFQLVLKLALSCTADKQQRPTTAQIVARLEKALDISLRDNPFLQVSIT